MLVADWCSRASVEHYGANLRRLVDLGLVERDRSGTLLDRMAQAPDPDAMLPVLIGEAMMAVGGVILAAIDAGLGTRCRAAAGRAGCRAGDFPATRASRRLVLALGWRGRRLAGPRAPKLALGEVFYDGAWDVARAEAPGQRGAPAAELRCCALRSSRCRRGRWPTTGAPGQWRSSGRRTAARG
ncbi:MAG: hypothetical protein U0S48_11110 [Solirubrobacteraceae bacterium]